MDPQAILKYFPGWDGPDTVLTPFLAEEDARAYTVWKVRGPERTAVLKKTEASEARAYEVFFSDPDPVPQIYGKAQIGEDTYLLMEYFPGETLSKCQKSHLILALDGLIALQEKYWQAKERADFPCTFDEEYTYLQGRLDYMEDLAPCYQAYLDLYETLPRTLCHDDLLPFNVLCDGERAVFIDWEYAGILPYPTALARLLAFGEEDTDFLFYMTEADKAFGLDYYYEKLIKNKSISRPDYDRTMQLFFFKEYSEWVYTARKAGDVSGDYYKKYYEKSCAWAKALGLYQAK
jgi:aminoglycoside phosphotransferase